ncbi:glycosyltransferase family 2 protein, partial [Enterococcus faecium]
MSHPIFSIIVPVYNAEDTIVHTIEVLKNLAFEEYEVILVNDGSTDKTEQLIQSAIQGDSHFQLFTTENQGPGLARNEGIKQSTGKYVLFFDADDEPVKEILADYQQLFEQYPEADLL